MRQELISLLKREVKPAMGCTEPVAVTLAAAKARMIGNHGDVDSLDIEVSSNIYKNGLAVGIPKTDEVGISIAGAIGATSGDSSYGLRIYETISEDSVLAAKKLVSNKRVDLKIADNDEKVYIAVTLNSKSGTTKVVIQGMHNHFAYAEHNEEVIIKWNKYTNDEASFDISKLSIKEIIDEVDNAEIEPLSFLLDGITMNERVAQAGLDKKLGMGVGYSAKRAVDTGILGNDLSNVAMYLTAAASDARMSGISLPVMSSNGSGNNGLTAILPIVAYKIKYNPTDDNLIKALAISHLINCYIKNQIGRLSALCSCGISAATGAGAAITWLMGGSLEHISGTVQNMIANLSGMICDGAKNSCSLKLATAASTGVNAAIFSLAGTVAKPKDGIVATSVELSIRNLGILSEYGMKITDTVILGIMQDMQ